MAPNWIRTANVSQNSLRAKSLPRNRFTSKRWPVDDTGRNSVSPSTMPSTMALKKSNNIKGLRADRGKSQRLDRPAAGWDVRLFYQHQPGGNEKAGNYRERPDNKSP